MSNVIQFLESAGRKPLTAAEYGATVAALEVDDASREALLGRDHQALNDLLGGRPKMYFMVVAPDEEQDTPEEAPEDAPDEKQPEE
jgi:hypothetical protein